MDKSEGQNHAARYLYPPIAPYNVQKLSVGQGHYVYVEQCGNPEGIPVVVVHGGPGGGCSPAMRRYFDPQIYNIVLFDQRGCGRSEPHCSVDDNSTWHLVADMELIREALGIERWAVFGGSWGATLSLIYAQTHPERVTHLILRGVFLMTQRELDWFYGGGAGQFFPEHWSHFRDLIPQDEQDDLIGAYHKRLFSGDYAVETRYAQAWALWENTLACLDTPNHQTPAPAQYARAFSKLENHYFINRGFLETDGQILRNRYLIEHIPTFIVHGRYDMICPPKSAYDLAENWPNAALEFVPAAGHSLSEPEITAKLVAIMDNLHASGRR